MLREIISFPGNKETSWHRPTQSSQIYMCAQRVFIDITCYWPHELIIYLCGMVQKHSIVKYFN